ncbi:hypothetical protein [Bordetella sp. FB-8]|uniref:hypothetical protein n=1 Tax=Bordetella sp. FB-8 TaxID=1159870 RepID=UPI0012DC0DD2|nr:hypothetical protein [Bordetella sp. FB-8]
MLDILKRHYDLYLVGAGLGPRYDSPQRRAIDDEVQLVVIVKDPVASHSGLERGV